MAIAGGLFLFAAALAWKIILHKDATPHPDADEAEWKAKERKCPSSHH